MRRGRSRNAIVGLGIAAVIVVLLQFHRAARTLAPISSVTQVTTPRSTESSSLSPIHSVLDQAKFVPPREPTHESCRGYNGVYHIAMGDIGGAAGTIFYQFVIAQILYAERHNLKPFVHFSNVSHVIYDDAVHGVGDGVSFTAMTGRNATYVKHPNGHRRDFTPGPPDGTAPVSQQTLHLPGTGVWNHYFEPISDFVPGDASCETSLYVTMDLYLITPGLHTYANYTPKCWRYKTLPDYISQPHFGSTEWLYPQRKAAHDIVRRYIRPRRIFQTAAASINPDCSATSPCLGLHIRHSDKASGRRVIETDEFLPFVRAFLEATTTTSYIYLATDSSNVLSYIRTNWPTSVVARIRTIGASIVRSDTNAAVFDIGHHHRTNVEVLIELLALARCQFLIHGYSAVSEAAIWNNLELHDTSVNLEDEEHIGVEAFTELVTKVIRGTDKDSWPHPVTTSDIWPELYNSSSRERVSSKPTHQACVGYDGVLLISNVGQVTAGRAFFHSILNQLVFAERNSLKPWIHLRSDSFLYDEQEHGDETSIANFQMRNSLITYTGQGDNSFPDSYDQVSRSTRPFTLQGNGIWESYFQPVSDFVPGDASCQDKPVVELDEKAIAFSNNDPSLIRPWSVPETGVSVLEHYQRQNRWRLKGVEIVRKYFRLQPYILNRADQVNHPLEWNQPCLGVHLRNGEKSEEGRKKVSPKEFVPYIEAFVRAGGKMIYVASDSHRALQFLKSQLPDIIINLIQTQGTHVVRSTKLDWPLHMIGDHHRVNAEVLVDIIALSRCFGLLHSSSTTSEAAIYLNPDLSKKSVNLELESPSSPLAFQDMIKSEMP